LGKYRGFVSRVLKGERLERSIYALRNLDKLAKASELIDRLTTGEQPCGLTDCSEQQSD
jgi:hypothetical protein